jgi:hypothetical protein
MQQHLAKVATLVVEKKTLGTRLATTQQDLEGAKVTIKEYTTCNEALGHDLKESRDQVSLKTGELTRLEQSFNDDVAKLESESSNYSKGLKDQLSRSMKSETEAREKVVLLERKLESTIAASAEQEERARTASRDEVSQFQRQLSGLQEHCSTLEPDAATRDRESVAQTEKCAHEKKMGRMELERMHAEKAAWVKRLSISEESLKECRNEVRSLQLQMSKELEEKLQRRVEAARTNDHQDADAQRLLQQDLNLAQRKMETLSIKMDQQAKAHRDELQKEIKISSAYKKKAIEAHNRKKQILKQC